MELRCYTYDKCAQDPMGTIYFDWVNGDYRFIILRGPICITAYVGVLPGHKYYGIEYYDIPDFPDVHGGLTYSGNLKGIKAPDEDFKQRWWIGWDYAHHGDKVLPPPEYDFNLPINFFFNGYGIARDSKFYDPYEVLEELKAVEEVLTSKNINSN